MKRFSKMLVALIILNIIVLLYFVVKDKQIDKSINNLNILVDYIDEMENGVK